MDLRDLLTQFLESIGGGLLNFIAALAFLVGGWIVALIIAALIRVGLRRTEIDNRIARAIAGEEAAARIDVEKWIARVVFYVILLFALVGFLNQLNLEAVAQPLQALLNELSTYLPSIIGAGLIAIVAWLLATSVRFLITQVADRTNLDERLTKQADLGEEEQVSFSKTLAGVAYWVIWLLFLPAILSALGLSGLVSPVQNLLDSLLGAVPNIFAAGLVLLIGWFVARIVRQVVTNLLMVSGADKVGERVGLPGDQTLSKLTGTVIYALIMISTLVAALGELQIDAISGPATAMLNTALNAIPAIFGAALILALAFLVSRLVSGLVVTLLTGIKFDNLPGRLGLNYKPKKGQRTPSEMVGLLVVVAIMLFAGIEAVNLLGFTLLAVMIRNFSSFGGQVILAVIIFSIGIYLANLAREMILGTGGQKFTANVTRLAVLVFAGALALRQLGIADEIVNLAFGILLGALGIAAALAFGLGSREIAGREVEGWIENLRSEENE